MASEAPAYRDGRVSFTLIFLRFLVCTFAFLFAVLVAGLVGTFALYRGLEGDPAYEAFYWGTAILAVFAAAHTTFLPSALAIILTEALRLRGAVVFGLAGALVGMYGALDALGPGIGLSDRRMLIAAAAGIVGGLAYWLIAGRRAGAYRERRYTDASGSGPSEA